LEIGTLGGYSGTWLASAMPAGGKLVSLELDPHHAQVATSNFERAGLAHVAEVVVGPAAESMDRLIASGVAPFDLIFIDADKPGYVAYLERALKLIRKGGLILGDNALSHGVLDGDLESGITKFNTAVAQSPTLTSALVPVMKHGVDGFTISIAE
jgi:predicted O-methyltransferase YrrM